MEILKPIDTLKAIALYDKGKQYPNVPKTHLVIHKYTDKTANGLTRCIKDFLTFHGHQVERINTMGRQVGTQKVVKDVLGRSRTIGSTKYIPTTGTKGSADISATIFGRSVKIEVKVGKDRQSLAQKQYQQAIEASGGVYYIARNFNSFYEFYCFRTLFTGIYDMTMKPIFVGDTLLSEFGYKVRVDFDESGEPYGKLICEDDHPCKDMPYDITKGYVKC